MEKQISLVNKQNLLEKAVNSIIVKRQKHFEEKLQKWRKQHEEEYKDVIAEINEQKDELAK